MSVSMFLTNARTAEHLLDCCSDWGEGSDHTLEGTRDPMSRRHPLQRSIRVTACYLQSKIS